MRLEKLAFDREVGNIRDKSWMSLSYEEPGYELDVRTDLRSNNEDNDKVHTEWNCFDLDGIEDVETELEEPRAKDTEDGVRIVYPGTSKESEASFSLNNSIHKGILGEVQAAAIYDTVSNQINTENIELYDFVEWYQKQPEGEMSAVLTYGPEDCFAVDNSGLKASLEEYVQKHEMDGAQLKSGDNEEVIAELSTGREDSILRQSGLEAVNGILTQNPEQVRRKVNGE